MAKTLLTDYAFTPGGAGVGTITVPGEYALEQFLLITNVTAGVVIYQFNAPSKGAALSIAGGDTTLTLEANTAAMNSGDSLQIFADSGAGASARTVLSGSGAPGVGTGADGDFYIDTADTEIYGPKASGAWGSATSLVGPAGATGSAGAAGSTGATGAAGAAATISVGSVTTGAAGSSAAVTNAGTSSAATFNFTIPRGDTGTAGSTGATGATGAAGATGATGAAGAAATISVGTVTTGAAGSSATVTNTGSNSAAILAFSIPRGDTGATGATGSTGATGATGVVTATAPITYNSGTQTVAITAATTSAAGSMSATDKTKLDSVASGATANSSDATLLARANHTGTQAASTITGVRDQIGIACSDELTSLTTGTAKVTFRMPYAFTLTAVRLNVNTAPTGSALVVNIKLGGTTIFSTKPQIDAAAKTSIGSGTTAVISTSALTDDGEITIDIDQIGSTIAGKGLKVWLIGTRA